MQQDDWQAAARDWIGYTNNTTDVVTPELVRRFVATVPHAASSDVQGAATPPGIHWCLAQPVFAGEQLGEDGHPRRGLHLPAIPLQRRMWAGGELEFHAPLRVGDRIERTSTIRSVEFKNRQAGLLAFVAIEHLTATSIGIAITERQDIVYLEPSESSRQGRLPVSQADPAFTRVRHMTTNPVMLFRYSAITFNSHRIHYDYPYARSVENYPNLVVHGPLQATLLMNFAVETGLSLRRFRFTGTSPLYCETRFALAAKDPVGDKVELALLNDQHEPTMLATAEFCP
jgi:3-methylfumaryl-CoA hydratase